MRPVAGSPLLLSFSAAGLFHRIISEGKVKIADALLLQKDIAEEMSRLKELAKSSSHEWYRQPESGLKFVPNFDLEANHDRVKKLTKLHRKLSRAITAANNAVDLSAYGLSDTEYEGWL